MEYCRFLSKDKSLFTDGVLMNSMRVGEYDSTEFVQLYYFSHGISCPHSPHQSPFYLIINHYTGSCQGCMDVEVEKPTLEDYLSLNISKGTIFADKHEAREYYDELCNSFSVPQFLE